MSYAMEPATVGPDKFGLVMQCRHSMDGLLMKELQTSVIKILECLSIDQLKAFTFIGLNGIQKNMSYAQLLAIKSSINGIVHESKKKKKKANKKQEEKVEIPISEQSLTQIIPEQVISNVICPYLLAPEICKLAKVSRSLCIIAHTPSSFSNLCIRHDPYRFVSNAFNDSTDATRYTIDGRFRFRGGLHRFSNVKKLSLCMNKKSYENMCFPKAQHLILTGPMGYFRSKSLPILPSLTSVVFEGSTSTYHLLDFLNHYKAPADVPGDQPEDEQKEQPYFKSIAIVNCRFDTLHDDFDIEQEDDAVQFERYQSICKFILPLQPNQLKELKLEASYFEITDSAQYCDEWNEQFVDLERIKTSLSGLEGFVYSQYSTELEPEENQFYQLSQKLLENTNSFPHLRSIHIHSPSLLHGLLCESPNIYNNFTATPIKELCVTIPTSASPVLLSKLQDVCAKLTKCCFVIVVEEGSEMNSDFSKLCANILKRAESLQLFQLVLVLDDNSKTGNKSQCNEREKNIVDLLGALKSELGALSTSISQQAHAKRPLIFKLHVKSMHRTVSPPCERDQKGFCIVLRDLIFTYLSTFSSGIIQCKLSQNHSDDLWYTIHLLESVERLFDVDVSSKEGLLDFERYNFCNEEKDYAYYAISARSAVTKSVGCNLEYDGRWNTDCEFCCNTPWL